MRYTQPMSEVTTIKLPKALRDRLQARAQESGSSMASVVESLLEADLRARRFALIRAERLVSPPDDADERARDDVEQSAVADLADADDLGR